MFIWCAGAANLQAQWAALQEAAERVVVRVLAGQSSSFLSQARLICIQPVNFPVNQLHTIFLRCRLAAHCTHLWHLLKTPSAEALVHEGLI